MIKKISNSILSRNFQPFILLSLACLFCVLLPVSLRPQSGALTPTLLSGQSATVLSDGKWLLVGGESPGDSLSSASIWDPKTGATTALTAKLQHGRAWHTATVLPNETVFIFGGIGSKNQIIQRAELFDPTTMSFSTIGSDRFTGRARHTTTLLTDGTLLIAGGMGAKNVTLSSAELWDYVDGSVTHLPDLNTARRSHSANLTADGTVLIKYGADGNGDPLSDGDLFDPAIQKFTYLDAATLNAITPPASPTLVDALP